MWAVSQKRMIFVFLIEKEKRRLYLNLFRPSANFWLVNLVFSRQTVFFFGREFPFIDEPTVITKRAVASARRLGLGLKLYPTNTPRMLKKDLPRLIQSFSSKQKKRAAGRGCQISLIET